MKRFYTRAILYSLPLIIFVMLIWVIDPYYLFKKDFVYNKLKFNIGYSYDQGRRYKIFTYNNRPTDKIIIGASEINILNEQTIPEDGWHSLSYGGAPLQESLGMYWEVTKEHKLSKIIIAPEFIKYFNAISSANGDPYYANFNWKSSQSAIAIGIYKNKLKYFTDKYTLKSTWDYMVNELTGGGLRGIPDESKESFWKSQMEYAHKVYEGNVILSKKKDEIKKEFVKLKKDADIHGTDVMIVLPAQHTDLLKVEFSDPVYDTYAEYISCLVEIFGDVHYLSYFEGVSNDYKSFSDPFHCVKSDYIINSLFRNMEHLILNKENVTKELLLIKEKLNQTVLI